MSDKPRHNNHDNAPFLQRWSQRKLARHVPEQSKTPASPVPDQPEVKPAVVREQDLPPIESLHENSDIGVFLNESISETIQRQALRKLFHFEKFNFCDGLDDYAEDYTIFQPLKGLLDMHDKLASLDGEPNPITATDDSPAPQVDTQDTGAESLPEADEMSETDEQDKEN